MTIRLLCTIISAPVTFAAVRDPNLARRGNVLQLQGRLKIAQSRGHERVRIVQGCHGVGGRGLQPEVIKLSIHSATEGRKERGVKPKGDTYHRFLCSHVTMQIHTTVCGVHRSLGSGVGVFRCVRRSHVAAPAGGEHQRIQSNGVSTQMG